jgi:hypothetical protein
VRAAVLLCDARSSRDLVEPLLELGIERPLRMILEQVLGCPSSFVFVARFRLCLLAVLFALIALLTASTLACLHVLRLANVS